MTLLYPAWLIAAGAAALGVMLLHLIVTRDPDVAVLPTARFAPDQVIEARTRRLTPRDLLLMLLRVAIVLAAGLALAHPVLRPPRRALARIVVVDRSRAVADPREAADSARSLLRSGDLLVLFDSAAGPPLEDGADSLPGLVTSSAAGRLSPALIAALRAASSLSDRVDSIGLVLVSPLMSEELDAATDSIRGLWPGGIRVIRTAAARDSTGSRRMSFEGTPDDPLRLALPEEFVVSGSARIRIARGSGLPGDSAWAGQPGNVLVLWPADGAPPGWTPRPSPDTVGAVVANGEAVVAPFPRRHAPAVSPAPTARVVARWVDGEPAAIEAPTGAGCIRSVAIEVPSHGDLVLSARFGRLAAALTAPCGGLPRLSPAGDGALASLAGPAGSGPAPARALPRPGRARSPLAPWLLLTALLLLIAEPIVRRPRPA